jgi:NAD(P)-dependent dehydrogenase (short-subunit alcohol dehydrogenase family)
MSVLITGGGGGLGGAIAIAFAARNVPVALVDLMVESAEENASAVRSASGVDAVALQCDITDSPSLDAAWLGAESTVGPVEVVVNCAGVFAPRSLLDLSLEAWNRTLAINLTGAFLVSQRAAREWTANGIKGSIVNVASLAAFSSKEGLFASDYGASKAGLVGLTVHMAVDFGPYGIRCNAVAPGSFSSPMNASRLQSAEDIKAAEDFVPMRRIGEAAEVARTIAFLALDGTYINGQVVAVDGGTAARM